ncbi:uncharacterized protein [Typha latifolia]|uniref:uncharacterized protein isoform X1 n=1 Tax=Typha latifolia TaxID=4733 RepID=UPI003C2C261B
MGSSAKNPRRRSRSKIRKPKYVSLLRLHLDSSYPPQPPEMPSASKSHCPYQLDLFPLHPEHERDPHVALLLGSGDCAAVSAPSLTDLIGVGSPDSSSPVEYDVGYGGGDGDGLASRVLRGRERWVYYCSSAASSSEEEALSVTSGGGVDLWRGALRSLDLKLDYEEILSAWSDRGSLYIDGDAPQVVPEVYPTASPVLVDVGSTAAVTWQVPDQKGIELGNGKEGEVRNREARVMRYKEKRRSRLFAKRIRYEVRKLNAEKRPRLKGRFVKSKDDI